MSPVIALIAGLVLFLNLPAAQAYHSWPPPTGTGSAAAAHHEDPAAADRLFELLNAERDRAGLVRLVRRDDLTSVAGPFAWRLAEEERLRHNDEYFTRESFERHRASKLGENVATAPSAERAHQALMDSPPHRANILDPEFRVIGLGAVRDYGNWLYFVEDFLAPDSSSARGAERSH